MIDIYLVNVYQKSIEDLVWSIESKPTKRIWEYNRKYKESLEYLDTGISGSLLENYSNQMGISLNEASQIIIWKFEQYQSVMPELDRIRNKKLLFLDGMDYKEADSIFQQILKEIESIQLRLADPS